MRSYEGPGGSEDVPGGVALDASGNIYVTGLSYAGIRYRTATSRTVKYDGEAGISYGWPATRGPATDMTTRLCPGR